MTGAQEVELFSRLAGIPAFEAWLKLHDEDAMKYLKNAVDPLSIHRTQGKSLFIEEMTKLLAKGKALR